MHIIESRFVIRPSSILFDGVYVCTFDPGENVTGWGSEGLNDGSSLVAHSTCWVGVLDEVHPRVEGFPEYNIIKDGFI